MNKTELSMQLHPQKPYSFENQKTPEKNHNSYMLSISNSTDTKLQAAGAPAAALNSHTTCKYTAVCNPGAGRQLAGADQHCLCASIPNPGIQRSRMMRRSVFLVTPITKTFNWTAPYPGQSSPTPPPCPCLWLHTSCSKVKD